MIFVNSMSDLFHRLVPDEFIGAVFGVAARCPWHTLQILTKRAERLPEWFKSEHASPSVCLTDAAITNPQLFKKPLDAREAEEIGKRGWPLPNVWLGVSVEDQKNKDRIDLLRQTPAAVRFLSIEPLLEDIGELNLDGIHQVISGGESGPGARPSELEWFRSVKNQCAAAGVALFMKQITEKGRKIPFERWPGDLRVREFPEAKNG